MITLNASGSSVTFTFSGNSTYLNDGQITVPVNSLALIIDESDMATFRKAASNDIFVSANIAEFGMTKAELESWYKANMVGSTGGGGGTDTGTVQTMIDESISGKADSSAVTEEISAAVSGKANSSDVYTTGQTSGATEIANALNAKLDATAYTPTVVDAALSQSSTNPVQNQALYGELRVGGGTSKVEIDFNTGGYVPEGVTQLEVNPTTTDSWAYYNFYNGNTNLGSYHFTNWGSFEVGNSLEGSSYVISGETVIITYPASLGVTRIAQDGGNAPWSFEAIVETPAVPLKDVVSGKVDTDTYSAYTANTTPKVDAAWANSIKSPSLYYDYTSGITLSSSPISGGDYNYSSIATDASIDDDKGVLGVYASGATHSVTLNQETKYNRIDFIPKSNLVFKASLNQSYTGTLPTQNAIQIRYKDFDTDYSYKQGYWDYNSGTDSFSWTTNPSYVNNTGVSMSYDSVSKVLTFTIDPSIVDTYGNFRFTCPRSITPASALTQADCFIGLIEYDTNQYKLQEALDNKVDASDVTTAVTSGSTDVVTSGGVYAKMGGMTIVKITESDYQSLSVKDPDTLYVVIPDPTNP